jgi:alkylated DNA nucleotide flippase Atl1
MASSRAEEVAEVLFELKRAGKVSTYSHIAKRAGFSAGSNGKVMDSCLKVVRRDWPHLHWWRAVKDDGLLETGSEQAKKLAENGYDVEATGDKVKIIAMQSHVMVWLEPEPAPVATAPESDDVASPEAASAEAEEDEAESDEAEENEAEDEEADEEEDEAEEDGAEELEASKEG